MRTVNVLDPANYAEGTVLDLAGPLADGEVVLDEIVAPRAPWSAVITQGDVLTIVDVGGNQSGDCLLYNARDTAERYSVPDTIAWLGIVLPGLRIPAVATNTVTYIDGALPEQGAVDSVGFSA